MTSERRAAAARANGAKSRGPVTARGKANSARNSLRHGLYAKNIFYGAESSDQFLELLAEFRAYLCPRTSAEDRLVEIMAVASCNQRHAWRMETAVMNEESRNQKSLAAAAGEPIEDDAACSMAFRALCDNSRLLDLINRFDGRSARQFDRALGQFHRLRARAAGTGSHRLARPTKPADTKTTERTRQHAENVESAVHATASPITESLEPAPDETNRPSAAGHPARNYNIAERTHQMIANTPSAEISNPATARHPFSHVAASQPVDKSFCTSPASATGLPDSGTATIAQNQEGSHPPQEESRWN